VRGVHYGGDTGFYLGNAQALLDGKKVLGSWSSPYLGYICFIAIHKFLGLNEPSIIISQVALSALVTVTIYDLGRRLAGEGAGVISASLYAVNLDIARFTFSILTDSLFTSIIVLAIYSAYRGSKSSFGWAVLSVILAAAAGMVRSNGWVIMPAILVFLILSRIQIYKLWHYLIIAIIGVVSIVAVSRYLDWYLKGNILEEFVHGGQVVWGEEKCVKRGIIRPDQSWALTMPSIKNEFGEKLSLVNYCMRYKSDCLRLFISRIVVSFAHIRAFYSERHNLVIGILFSVLYLAAVVGFLSRIADPFTLLIIIVIALHMSVVGYIGADWDGRFLTYIFPFITLYSGIGAVALYRKVIPRLKDRIWGYGS